MSAFAVLGPGGVGGLLGALLARQGHDVVCLAGQDTVTALREGGLHLRSRQFGDVDVSVRAATVLDEPVTACLVTVKATQLDAALERVPPAALGPALIVPFLNGVEHVDALRRRYPPEQVVAGTLRVESARVAPGRIEHLSPFATVELAGPRAAEVAGPLREAGLDVEVREDETAMLLSKLSFLAPVALTTAAARAPVGNVRTDHRDELLAVVGEVAAVAHAEGAPIDVQGIEAMVDRVPAAMRPSMLRDAEAGRSLELDAIGGTVLRAAARRGVPVPVTARLVSELEKGTT
jgi:2-dehydropantoate 2-reductase